MSIRTFFRIYSLPFLIILGGLAIYGVAVIVMDKENLIISHSSEHYSQHQNKPLTEDTQVFTNIATNEGTEQLGTDIVTSPTEIEVSTLLETNEPQIDSTQIASNEINQTQTAQNETNEAIQGEQVEASTTPQESTYQVAQTQQTYYVKHRANIRKAPSLDAAVIVGALEGETLEVLEKGEEWTKIRNSYGVEGYIASRLINKVETQVQEGEAYIVLVDNLNVRIEPSKSAAVIAHLRRNERIFVVETQGEWAKITRPNGKYAYISAQFITKASR